MKKILITVLLLFCSIQIIFAEDASTSLTGTSNIEAGEEFTLTFNINGNNMWGVQGSLMYDTSKLSLVSSSGKSGFTATIGSSIVLDSASAINGNVAGATLTFKASSSFNPGESTTITISNLKGATDIGKFTISGCSKTIKVNIPKSSNSKLSSLNVDGSEVNGFSSNNYNYNLGNTDKTSININASKEDDRSSISGTGNKTLEYGENKFNIVVTAENGSKSTYTIRINRNDNRSSNNYLSKLSIDKGEIKFNKNTTTYNLIVENNVNSVKITAESEDNKSSISGTGSKKLDVYLNTFKIIVTAENGSKRTYKINVSRKDENGNKGALSTNNRLSSITISNYDLEFDPNILNYSLTVDNNVTKLDISAKLQDEEAQMEIKNPNELLVGNNTITIDVISQSGNKNTYTINVTRKDDSQVTTIMELDKIISETNSKNIVIEIKDDINEIPLSTIDKIKGKDINFRIEKYEDDKLLYSWKLNGKNIAKSFDFNTLVSLESEKKDIIEKQINYIDSIYINYYHEGELPKDTKFKLYVGDKYSNGDILNFYYYNEKTGNIELEQNDIIVENGYVEYKLSHASNYILTKANLIEKKSINVFMIISIIEFVLLLVCTYFIFIKKKNKKRK